MNNIIKTNAITTTDEIQDEFHLYYWIKTNIPDNKHFRSIPQIYSGHHTRCSGIYKSVLEPKYHFMLQNQIGKINLYGIHVENCIYLIDSSKKIPKRYKSKTKKIDYAIKRVITLSRSQGPKKYLKHSGYEFYEVTYPIPLISLIEQRFTDDNSKNIVKFFKSLNQQNGVSFDDYIDNWVQKLLKGE